jgi:hypothetical protein
MEERTNCIFIHFTNTRAGDSAMSLHNCKQCGLLFMKSRSDYCSACQTEYDEYYSIVRTYLKGHPNSTVLDIHKDTGIAISKLLVIRKDDYVPYGHTSDLLKPLSRNRA